MSKAGTNIRSDDIRNASSLSTDFVATATKTNPPLPKLVEYTESKFSLHSFNKEILDTTIIYHVVKMTDSLLIYINEKDRNQFINFSLAMNFGDYPVGTNVMGGFTEESFKSMACRLSKKTGKVILLSCNVKDNIRVEALIEQGIKEEMNEHPEKF